MKSRSSSTARERLRAVRYSEPLRIEVRAGKDINPQTRIYAEYGVFATLAQLPENARRARVTLRTSGRDDAPGARCSITVWLYRPEPVRVRAEGRHPYEAINGALDRLALSTPAAPRSASS